MRKFELIKEYPTCDASLGQEIVFLEGVTRLLVRRTSEFNVYRELSECADNPEYWKEVTETPEELSDRLLVEEAIRRYPIGSIVKCLCDDEICAISSHITDSHTFNPDDYGEIWFNKGNVQVYGEGMWADIVNPLFTSIDGVEINEGDDYYFIQTKKYEGNDAITLDLYTIYNTAEYPSVYTGSEDVKRFKYRFEAEKWLEDNKPAFITDDKVAVFVGDMYWFISDNIYASSYYTPTRHRASRSCGTLRPMGCVQFSTEQLAQDYADFNKPKYSEKDIVGLKLTSALVGLL